MAQGLQIFNNQGKCTYDSAVNTSTFIGTFTIQITQAEKTGSFYEPRLNPNKLWWFILKRTFSYEFSWGLGLVGMGYKGIEVIANDKTISWRTPQSIAGVPIDDTVTIAYGTYI